jgi:hypothetical protein
MNQGEKAEMSEEDHGKPEYERGVVRFGKVG